MAPVLSNTIRPGVMRGVSRVAVMRLAASNGVAKGSITGPTAVPASGTHHKFSAVFGGCSCAGFSEFPDYCVPTPAPATPAALLQDVADYFNSVPDVAQYLYFTVVGSNLNYTSILPGLVVTTLNVPGGFVHTQTATGLIACQEILPGRAVVSNPCRVPTADNPYEIALAASADAGDTWVGVVKKNASCSCKCKTGNACGCFTIVTGGTVGIELGAAVPACPFTAPLSLGYQTADGKFILYAATTPPAGVKAVNRAVQVLAVQGMSALIRF